jgi:membrane protein YqaA with SNARE-associated domain
MMTLIALFLGALLAATIVPFSSEVMLLAAISAGEVPLIWLIAAAATGNIAGALINWSLGRYLLHWVGHPWFPFNQEQLGKASERFNRYGVWTLLFSFLPIVGDPLTFAAGMLRVGFWPFLILVSIGKTARYAFLGWAF